MLEATRYAVLFLFTWFASLVLFVAIFIVYVFSTQDFGVIILLFAITMKEIILLIAITLSWKFSHVPYEKICENKCIKCHSWMERYCEDLISSNNLKKMEKVLKK